MTTPKTGDGGKVTPSASLSSSSFGLSPSINVTTKTAAPSTAVAETAAVAGVLRVSYYALPRAMLCIGFVTRGHCPRGASCMYHHSANGKPYQWQWQRTNTESTDSSVPTTRPPAGNGVAPWIDFGRKANNVLEWTFSDESKSDCNVTDEGNESDKGGVDVDGRQLRFKVDFDRMKFTDGETCGRVRRLEVESSGVDGFSNSDASTADVPDRNLRRYATVWRWFWLDKRTWKPYESNQPKDVAVVTSVSRQDQQQKQFCSTTTGYISSETIELAYRCNPDGRITFVASISGTSYIIDFSERVQVNQETGFCRKMRRRPAPWPSTSSVLADSLLNTAEAIFKPSVQFPATWDLSLVAGDSRYQLINVTDDGPTADEYDEVAQLFYSSMNTSIKSIQRIQNLSLWEKFCQFRTDAARRRRQPVDVRRLFHGTKEKYIEAIFSNGFDWRLFGKSSGTVYGKGSYFARDAVYSSEYTDCNKMFLVQVENYKFTIKN